jgi:hypothetical protein
VADTKITALTAYGTEHGNDVLPIVDVHDTTMASSGTDKACTIYQLFGNPSTGQLIYWNGSSTGVPAGATDWTVGSSGQLNMAAIADYGSPSAGDLWYSSATNSYKQLSAGMPAPVGGIVWQALSTSNAVANTTTQTSLLSSVGTTSGTLTIPANGLTAGKVIRPVLWGTNGNAGSVTLTFYFYLGGNIVWAYTSGTLATCSGQMWVLYSGGAGTGLQVQSTGSSGKLIGSLGAYSGQTGGLYSFGGGTNSGAVTGTFQAGTQQTINTTTSLAMDFQVKWSVANASNTIQLQGGYISIDG